MTQPENFLSVREAAAYLGCAEALVRRLVRRRALRAVRVGPRLRFRLADLERYLAQRLLQPAGRGARPQPGAGRRDASLEGEILYAVMVAAAGEHRLDRLLAGVLEQLGYAIAFTGGSIAMVEGEELVIRAAVGPFARTALGLRQPRGPGIAWRVVSTREPFLSHDLLAEGRRPTSNFRSYLAVPLLWRSTAIGMLELDSLVAHAFTEADLRLVQRIGVALGGAVELARRYNAEAAALASAEQARRRLHLLAEATAAFTAAGLELPAVLEMITRRAAEVLGDSCSILLRSEDGQRLDLAVSYHPDPAILSRIRTLLAAVPYRLGAGSLSAVVRTGEAVLVPTLAPDQLRALTNPDYWPYLDQIPMASMLIVPLRARGAIVGVLAMTRDRPGHPYTTDDQQLLQDLADRAALTIANAQLHAAVSEQREWFRATLSSITDGITVQDRQDALVYVNDAAARLCGFATAAEMLATPPREILARFAIFDADGNPFPLDKLPGRLTLWGQRVPEVELRFRALSSGMERWAVVSATPLYGAGGGVELAINIFRDVTDQKRAELTQRFLSEASVALAASLDETTTLRTVASLAVPALADWCVVDLLREDDTLETVAMAHVDPEKVALGWEVARRYPLKLDAPHGTGYVVRTGQSELVPEVPDALLDTVGQDAEHTRLLRALGLRGSMCVPLLVSGRPIGTLAFVSDRPGRFGPADLELAQELARRLGVALENARLYAAAQSAIAAREQFLSLASHELKTPLTTLLGYVGLLQRRLGQSGTLSPRDLRALQTIEAQTQRLDKLILALLDLSRLQAGQLSVEPAPYDLAALARQVVEESQPALDRHTLRLEIPAQPVIVDADGLRLEQVVQNLVQNAVKYSPDGGEVLVRVFTREQTACLEVIDQGIGIPADALPQLFRRFYRAPNVNGKQISGMGVGLYVVREIMALHGGTVEVSSQEGQGSTFTICFPYAESRPAA